MQAVRWYFQRLKSMDIEEIFGRIKVLYRNNLNLMKHYQGNYPNFYMNPRARQWTLFKPGFKVIEIEPGLWSQEGCLIDGEWKKKLISDADKILRHKLSYFNLEEHFHEEPIDWNRDHSSGKKSPLKFASKIDYRNFEETGDCKLVWEPNRHHQLVVLGRAFRGTGKEIYAVEIARQIESWMEQCPIGIGMNWRSPMELAIRIINWVWAIDLIYGSSVIDRECGNKILQYVYAHLLEITNKFSHGSSANNHLIGEAAGVYIAASYFQCLPNVEKWKEQSKEILIKEIFKQTHVDGGGREQAFGYQLFVLQFFIFAAVVGKKTGDEFPQIYMERIEKMIEFLSHIAAGGEFPMVGDCDDGYVLDLGNRPNDLNNLICIGAILFNNSSFKFIANEYSEAAYWLLGPESKRNFEQIMPKDNTNAITSIALSDSGYYLLQAPFYEKAGIISVLIDCGELGYGQIAAHGHADALSFVLRVNKASVIIDPGTYDYFTYPKWRTYFRSSKAHNTVVIDNYDQSEMTGPFIWRHKAVSRCMYWAPDENGGSFVGEHDGYERLSDPVKHRRTYHLDASVQALLIKDKLLCKGPHSVTICFHLSPNCIVSRNGNHGFHLRVNGQVVALKLDEKLDAVIYEKDMDTKWGWTSSGYHKKHPSKTIVGTTKIHGVSTFRHRIEVE